MLNWFDTRDQEFWGKLVECFVFSEPFSTRHDALLAEIDRLLRPYPEDWRRPLEDLVKKLRQMEIALVTEPVTQMRRDHGEGIRQLGQLERECLGGPRPGKAHQHVFAEYECLAGQLPEEVRRMGLRHHLNELRKQYCGWCSSAFRAEVLDEYERLVGLLPKELSDLEMVSLWTHYTNHCRKGAEGIRLKIRAVNRMEPWLLGLFWPLILIMVVSLSLFLHPPPGQEDDLWLLALLLPLVAGGAWLVRGFIIAFGVGPALEQCQRTINELLFELDTAQAMMWQCREQVEKVRAELCEFRQNRSSDA